MFDPPGRLCHQPENSKLFCIWMIFKSSSEMPTPKGKEKKKLLMLEGMEIEIILIKILLIKTI